MPATDPKLVAVTEPVIVDLHARMGRLENTVAQAHTESAARDTQIALMKADISVIKDGQNKIFSGLNRILWTVGLGIAGAFGTFIMSGGYVVLQQ